MAAELQELAVDISMELAIVRRTLADDASGRLDTLLESALLRAHHDRHQKSLRAAAGAGARTIEMRTGPRGAALVRIDEGQWFKLSRADGNVLRVLARATVAADGFAGWQTYEQVADEVGRKGGRPPTRRALVESVYRLRRAFASADLNPYLISVNRKAGLRFLLRTRAPGQERWVTP